MKYLFTLLLPVVTSVFFLPAISHAATSAPMLPTTQALSTELSQISTELASTTPPGTAIVTLSPGQSTLQASTTSAAGLLQVSFPNFEYEKLATPASATEPMLNFARINLQYLPCVSAFSTSTACVSMASSSFPQMRSDLQQGQDTGYLHYLITLTSLSSTTATLQITDSSVLTALQNQVNAIAAEVHVILGT